MKSSVKRNTAIITFTQSLNALSDTLASAKIVLPSVMTSVGAPTFMIGLLVPIRESGALLPQLVASSVLRRLTQRKWPLALSFICQGLTVAIVAYIAANSSMGNADGKLLGAVILILVSLIALARSISSLTAKEALAKTVPQGMRGRVIGLASSIAGAIAVIVGGCYLLIGSDALSGAPILLTLAASGWGVAALLVLGLDEPSESRSTKGFAGHINQSIKLIQQDPTFKQFLGVRAAMMSSGLVAPFFVLAAQPSQALTSQTQPLTAIETLGALLLINGVASLVSGRF